jgi:hypothetical protein
MDLQVSHAARSRLCLAEGGHWLDEEAATVNGHGVTFFVWSHFPGPQWLPRFRLLSRPGLPDAVPAGLACLMRSLRVWPA